MTNKNNELAKIELNALMMISRFVDSSENDRGVKRGYRLAWDTAKLLGDLIGEKLYCKISNHSLFIYLAGRDEIVFIHKLWEPHGDSFESLMATIEYITTGTIK